LEPFGAIVAFTAPRSLVHVDQAMARSIGLDGGELWRSGQRHLSAPTEVHLLLSKRCSAGCRGCYVDATPRGPAFDLERAKRALDGLARAGVFHVALGGGEAIDLPFLFDVAEYARSVGIVPNLTTAGLTLDAEMARRCRVFGQINVSVDGVGEAYQRARGFDGFALAERSLRLLRSEKREVGVNCVVSRSSFDGVEDVVRMAKRLRLNEVELLRFKPSGRGAPLFDQEDLTEAQALAIYPLALRLTRRYRMRVKLDCSFAPMVFAHEPPRRAAELLGVQGCVGGDVLAAVTPDGQVQGCSFGGPPEGDVVEGAFEPVWRDGFHAFRDYVSRAPEPCRSCAYVSLCRGGCRVVAQHAGDWWQPDPGCPRVRAWRRANPTEASV
jgi:radical SAM protein with 4Fe4S-binding SPASM domain